MPISVQCPGCGKNVHGKDELAGKRVKCPKCGEHFELPEIDGSPSALPALSPPQRLAAASHDSRSASPFTIARLGNVLTSCPNDGAPGRASATTTTAISDSSSKSAVQDFIVYSQFLRTAANAQDIIGHVLGIAVAGTFVIGTAAGAKWEIRGLGIAVPPHVAVWIAWAAIPTMLVAIYSLIMRASGTHIILKHDVLQLKRRWFSSEAKHCDLVDIREESFGRVDFVGGLSNLKRLKLIYKPAQKTLTIEGFTSYEAEYFIRKVNDLRARSGVAIERSSSTRSDNAATDEA